MIRSMIHLFIACTVLLGATACKTEDPNPEHMDPIYKDLESRHGAYEKNLEESKAKIPALEEAIEKAEARSIDKKNAQKDLAKEKLKLMNAEQLSRYFRIRAERRKLTARIAYKRAFAEDKPWPDPKEYEDYQVNLRLQEANRNWSARVPKLQDRQPGAAPAKPKPPEGGGGGHH